MPNPPSLKRSIYELVRNTPMTGPAITRSVGPPWSKVRDALQKLHVNGTLKHRDGKWMGAAYYNIKYNKR